MSLETKTFYDFGNFRLDPSEKVLLREGETIPLTPKVFETLKLFVENPGRLIEKDELMQRLWPDRYVEESNLTFNIRMLRKALGDDKAKPRFIETVPKRGYRFIAEVSETTAEIVSLPVDPVLPPHATLQNKKAWIVSAVLVLAVLFFGFWYVHSVNLNANEMPILSAPFALEKLTTSGKTVQAVISPDGKNVVYTRGIYNEKQSVWLRQLDSGNNVEIIPPSDNVYYGLALSPDGNTVYFTRGQPGEALDTFRVPIFGGIPQRIISLSQGWTSISPDGSRISFIRCPWRDDDYCSLYVADAIDGGNEKKILTRPSPFRIGDNHFSPDGKSIAFAVGQSQTDGSEFELREVAIESGEERAITNQKFFNIRDLAWLPDSNDLIFTASRVATKNYRIWQVSRSSGEVAPLSKDSESYSNLSLDTRAHLLVSNQIKESFQLRTFPSKDPSNSRIIADATYVSFAPDEKILFTSNSSGNDEIWSSNSDGSGLRQLTNSPADELSPLFDPHSGSIFFSSNRTGEIQIWKMNADGSNQTQVTRKEGGLPLMVSPDGHWLYYHHCLSKTLWRVPVEGGEEQLILDRRKDPVAVSPDGLEAALSEKVGKDNVLTIVSLAEGQTVNTFKLADKRAEITNLQWSQDGASLAYISTLGEFGNKTLWRQSIGGSSPQKIADLGGELIASSGFSLSPDGKTFAIAQGGWQHDAVLLRGLK